MNEPLISFSKTREDFRKLPQTEEEVFSFIKKIQEQNPDKTVLVAQFVGVIPNMDELSEAFTELDPSVGSGTVTSFTIVGNRLAPSDIAAKIPNQWVVKTIKGPRVRTFDTTYFVKIGEKTTRKLLQP